MSEDLKKLSTLKPSHQEGRYLLGTTHLALGQFPLSLCVLEVWNTATPAPLTSPPRFTRVPSSLHLPFTSASLPLRADTPQ